MTIEQYKEQIKEDILENAKDYEGRVSSIDELADEMWTDDDITGNGSGSYFCNSAKAEEALGDLIWSDELLEMFKEYGEDRVPLEKGAEWIDVSVRCFLLNTCIYELEDELNEILGLEK